VTVVAEARHDTSDADVMAAFRSFGETSSSTPFTFRFEWSPILVSFESEAQVRASSEIESTVTKHGSTWRWTVDAYPFTTGRVLWRVANALRFFAMLTAWTDKGIFSEWAAEYEGETVATAGAASGSKVAVGDTFANLVAGEAGVALFAAMRAELSEHIWREDERTRASERKSSLIATFVADQLAVRPPISESEISALKRRLGLE
jgi:hypothetical protein